jgi:AraC-like DNA-binding protein
MDSLETSSIVLPGIINTALKNDVDIETILKKFDISLNLEDITQSTISLEIVHAIVIEVEKASKIPAIGLQTGEDFDFDFLPHLKTYLMSAATIREFFESSVRVRQLISPLLYLFLEERDDRALLSLRPNIELSLEDERHYVEMVFSVINSMVKKLMKEACPPKSVRFCHNNHELLPIYENCFKCHIRLGAAENAIVYDRSILDIPLPGGFPEIHRQAEQIVVQQLQDSPIQRGVAKKITRIMRRQKYLLNEPIETVAGSLNMSTRTLQRRLTDEGVNFFELKDQIRFDSAVLALKSRSLSIEEISEALGFSDRHSFTRAFKRWSGVTPSAFRKNLLK